MLPTFLDKISGFFDRRFILAYWSPVFVFVGLAVAEGAVIYGVEQTLQAWQGLTTTAVTVVGFATLMTITVSAYFLQAWTYPVVRLYAGYWPDWASRVTSWRTKRQKKAWRQMRGIPERLYVRYPREESRILPTRLGNVLVAAYDYSHQVYRINAPIWWPRLSPLLPEGFRGQVDGALTPLLALLNLATLLILLAVSAGGAAVWVDHRWWPGPLFFMGGLLAALSCYQAAMSQAASYGEQIRVGFDLYRHELLKQLHIPIPGRPRDEWPLWEKLGNWIYDYNPPWNPDEGAPDGDREIVYDYPAKPSPPSPPGARQFVVTLGATPLLTVTVREVEE